MHLLHAKPAPDKLRGEPVQQGRVRWFATELTEVTHVLLQAFAEMPLPQPIHRHTGEQRIVRSRQPVYERFNPPVPKIGIGSRERPAGFDFMVLLRAQRIAAGKDVTLFLRSEEHTSELQSLRHLV